jgi:hypothetical protein
MRETRLGISILIPTYRRPQACAEFARAADRAAHQHSRIEIIFGGHADDTATKQICESLRQQVKLRVSFTAVPKHPDGDPHLSQYWNVIYAHAAYDILGFFGDDCRITTRGWDDVVLDLFSKDPAILVYGDDVHCQRGDMATLFFTHKIVHERCGFYMFPGFRRMWMDQFWDQAFRRAGKIRLRRDLVFEHQHRGHGKFKHTMDETFRRLERMHAKERSYDAAHQELEKCIGIIKQLDSERKITKP